MSNAQFLNQFILFEDDKFIKDWEGQIKQFVNNIPTAKSKQFIDDIAEIKTMQKLENAPFALLALLPNTAHRNDVIEEIILSVENGLAMMKWIHKWNVLASFTADTQASIEAAISALSWPKHIPVLYNSSDPFFVKCEKVAKAVEAKNKKSSSSASRWGYEGARYNKKTDIPEDKIDEMELVDILANIRELNHIGMDRIISVIKGKSLDAGYIQPIQLLDAIILHKNEFSGYRYGNVGESTQKLNECLSELLDTQLSGLQKLNDQALFVLDGSGSMNSEVNYGDHIHIKRSDIAVLWAIVFSKLAKNAKTYITAAHSRNVATIKEVMLPCNILEAIDIYNNCHIGGGGIYTHDALERIKKDLDPSFKPKLCMVFADSEDDTPAGSRWPAINPVRIANKMILINAESVNRKIEVNAQWDAHIHGYTDYAVEYAYDQLGIANPTAKGSDFANGANYRVSF